MVKNINGKYLKKNQHGSNGREYFLVLIIELLHFILIVSNYHMNHNEKFDLDETILTVLN